MKRSSFSRNANVIASLSDVTTAIDIPDIARCFQLMDEYAMLPNIREHSVIVARAALRIIEGFEEGEPIPPAIPDRCLVAAGALLHDIAKTPCLKNGCDHARKGAEICLHLGYPEIASIVEEHVILRDHDAKRRSLGLFNAREIIYYADKRVRHEEIVSLEDRLEYILEHYGNGDPEMHRLIRINFNRCVELEEFLFAFLPFSPDQLAEEVAQTSSGGGYLPMFDQDRS
ncbi:MAG: HD domain-containing protein [Desulfobulbaceae bacterium]|nr:HD domain-containing protein [Desulfobulbaceae bacterium]